MMGVDVFVEPGCPDAVAVSNWLRQVEPHRDLALSWRPFSRVLHPMYEPADDDPMWQRSRRVARVMAAVAERHPDATGRFYRSFTATTRAAAEPPLPVVVRRALARAGLPIRYAGALDDAGLDDAVVDAMTDAASVVGHDLESPIVVLRGENRTGFCGPVVTGLLPHDEALWLWDAMTNAATRASVVRIHRPRRRRESEATLVMASACRTARADSGMTTTRAGSRLRRGRFGSEFMARREPGRRP